VQKNEPVIPANVETLSISVTPAPQIDIVPKDNNIAVAVVDARAMNASSTAASPVVDDVLVYAPLTPVEADTNNNNNNNSNDSVSLQADSQPLVMTEEPKKETQVSQILQASDEPEVQTNDIEKTKEPKIEEVLKDAKESQQQPPISETTTPELLAPVKSIPILNAKRFQSSRSLIELKEECKKRKLPVTGTKPVLEKRIQDHDELLAKHQQKNQS
jgi:hypothetical protein